MKWEKPRKEKNNGWVTRFALLPVELDINFLEKGQRKWVWLELYAKRHVQDCYYETREYEGCAERVGYHCDCYRH